MFDLENLMDKYVVFENGYDYCACKIKRETKTKFNVKFQDDIACNIPKKDIVYITEDRADAKQVVDNLRNISDKMRKLREDLNRVKYDAMAKSGLVGHSK